jgi:hypothetical protein
MSLATGASAHSGYGDRDGDRLTTVSYINGDGGTNADVDPNSSCFNPDQYDMQAFSSAASGNPGNNNVHNDACFLDDRGNKVGDGIGATFQASGTGYISACPDPTAPAPSSPGCATSTATAATIAASRAATRRRTPRATSSTTPASTTPA